MKYMMASSLGYQSMDPVNTRLAGASTAPFGWKYVVSTPVPMALMSAAGALVARRARSASETATVRPARAHALAS